MERKQNILGINLLIYLGIWGEAELILRIWGAKEKTFRELRNFLSGIWGDPCIIFRDKGSPDPPGAIWGILGVPKYVIIYVKINNF